jgi:hypothetical protein
MAMTAGRGKKLPRALESVRAAPRPDAIEHAVRLIHRVCCLAGSGTLIEDIKTSDATADCRLKHSNVVHAGQSIPHLLLGGMQIERNGAITAGPVAVDKAGEHDHSPRPV